MEAFDAFATLADLPPGLAADLANKQLSTWPATGVGVLPASLAIAHFLDLSRNKFTQLPTAELAAFQTLRAIRAQQNMLSSLPESLPLAGLQLLDLSG
jgi:hypothetical protein